ncbi:MAG TPA: hypothetical protein VIX15_05255 [Streptosporangiaceae bacterium]
MRFRLMATYLGVPYQAGLGPDGTDVTLFSPGPPPEELGFTASGGFWRKQVGVTDLDALWQSRPVGEYRGEPCLVLDDLGARLHIAYLGRDTTRAIQLGYWEIDREVFEVVVAQQEVTGLTEERVDFPLAAAMFPPSGDAHEVRPDPPELPVAQKAAQAVAEAAGSAGLSADALVPVPGDHTPRIPDRVAAWHGSPWPEPWPEPESWPEPGSWHEPGSRNGARPGHEAGSRNGAGPGNEPRSSDRPGPNIEPGLRHEPGQPAEPGSWNGSGSGHEAGSWNGADPGHQAGSWNGTVSGHEAGSWNGTVSGHEAEQRTEPGQQAEAGSRNGTGPGIEPGLRNEPGTWAEPQPASETREWAAPEATPPPARRGAGKDRVTPQSAFAELLGLAAISQASYAVNEEVPGAICLVKADGGFEVFSCTDEARLEVRFFEDEEAAYFYLFGVLAAEAIRSGRLGSRGPRVRGRANGRANGSGGISTSSVSTQNVSKYLRGRK